MGWITRFNQFYNLISNGVIPAANKNNLKTYNDETIRRHNMINYYNNVQVAPLAVVSDYNTVYTSFQTAMTPALADMTTDYTIPDVAAFTDLIERMTLSEGYILFLASKGQLSVTHLRILSSLSDLPTADKTNEVAMYQGGLYVYTTSWQRQYAKGYKGDLNAFPTGAAGNIFIFRETIPYTDQTLEVNGEALYINDEILKINYEKKQPIVFSDTLYVNGEALNVNGELLVISRQVDDGCIWYFDTEWKPDHDTASWRYAAAVEEFNDITKDYPDVVDNSKSKAKKNIDKNTAASKKTIRIIDTMSGDIKDINRDISETAASVDTIADELTVSFAEIKDGLEDIIESIEPYIPVTEEEND